MILVLIISICSLVLLGLYLLVIGRFMAGWDKIPVYIAEGYQQPLSISVIIAARNEEKLIGRCIESILAQDYPKEYYELIIIDDHSVDNTAAIAASYPGVKVISLQLGEQFNSYKKKAIAEGIKASVGELIVTTDADCTMGKRWLHTLVSYQAKHQCNMLAAPVSFYEESSWFERIQTAEFLFINGTGAGAIGIKMPFSCNGANLMYRKSIFNELGGFQGIDHLASGDDELLMHKVDYAYPGTVGFLKNPEAIVYTHAKPTLSEFLQQRKRWASKSVKYRNKVIVASVVVVWLFNCSLLVNLLICLFTPMLTEVLIVSFALKLLFDFLFMNRVLSFFGRKELLRQLVALQFLYMIYVVFIGVSGNSGRYYWKGRKVQ